MNVYRILEVKDGDTVDALRRFLFAWWGLFRFDALLAPVETTELPGVAIRVVSDRAGLEKVNPFAPLMPVNSAALLDQLVHEKPKQCIGAIMRPCEVRTFIELQKRQTRKREPENLILISVDCSGTYTTPVYQGLIQSRGLKSVMRETLQDATEGGLRARAIRTACLICEHPATRSADLTIGTIGVSTDRVLLLISRDELVDARSYLDQVTDGVATEYQASHREALVGAMTDMRAGMRRTLTENLPGAYRFNDLGSFFGWLASCSLCGKCLEACPLYELEFKRAASRRKDHLRERALLSELVHLSRWLASCSGCGMCAENCLQQVPFSLLISSLGHRIRQEMGYTPGDPARSLPWADG